MSGFSLQLTRAARRFLALLLILAADASFLAAVTERQRHERVQRGVESSGAAHFHAGLVSRNYGDFLPARP
jgi:hypothetical protein